MIDGASSDGTLDILKEYPVSLLVSEQDGGIYQAMNKGIRLAKGEFVIFINGGDYFHHAEVLSEVFENKEHPEDISYGSILVGNGLNRISAPPKKIDSPRVFIGKSIPHQSSFIRKNLFYKYGFYDESLRLCSDWKQWIVFAFNKCSFKNLNLLISVFDDKGISTVRPALLQQEYVQIIDTFFLPSEAYGSSKSTRWVKLFGVLPLLKIRFSRNKKKVLLFGIILLFSLEDKPWA